MKIFLYISLSKIKSDENQIKCRNTAKIKTKINMMMIMMKSLFRMVDQRC